MQRLPVAALPESRCCWRAELRRARLQFKKGQLSAEEYEKVINDYMRYANDEQERIGLDVFVHGEPERTDMCARPSLLFSVHFLWVSSPRRRRCAMRWVHLYHAAAWPPSCEPH